jgi:hypothetical protein
MVAILGALIIAAQVSIDTAKVSQAMIAELQRTRAPGAAIGIIVDGKLMLARGYGGHPRMPERFPPHTQWILSGDCAMRY